MTIRILLAAAVISLAGCGGSSSSADAGPAFTYTGFTPIGGFGTSLTAGPVAGMHLLPDDLRTGRDGMLYMASSGGLLKIDPATLVATQVIGAPGARSGSQVPATGDIRSIDFNGTDLYLGIDRGTTNVIAKVAANGSYTELATATHADARDAVNRVRVSPVGDVYWSNRLDYFRLNSSAPVDPYNAGTIHDCQFPDLAPMQTYCVDSLEIDPAMGYATTEAIVAGVDGMGNLLLWNTRQDHSAGNIGTATTIRGGTGAILFDIGFQGSQPTPPAADTIKYEIDTGGVPHPGLVAQAARTPDGSYWTYTLSHPVPAATSLNWYGEGLYVHRP
jgi:hypothetical protein